MPCVNISYRLIIFITRNIFSTEEICVVNKNLSMIEEGGVNASDQGHEEEPPWTFLANIFFHPYHAGHCQEHESYMTTFVKHLSYVNLIQNIIAF